MTQAVKEISCDSYILSTCPDIDADQAYVRSAIVNNEVLWLIYDGTGEKIGHASSREMAMAVASQNELIPFNVH